MYLWTLLCLLFSVSFAAPCVNRTTPVPAQDGDYDFIIAGAGTAGAIVAARLASANFNVLVIESGFRLYDNPDLSAGLLAPVLTGTDFLNSTIVPQIHAQKREVNYPRGNMIGGSSGANAMIFFRGSVQDFETWENEYGLDGWGYDDVLPYFKKFENNEDVKNAPSIHGYSGPINITIVQKQFPSPPATAWANAAQKLGYPKIQDASDPRTVYGASDSWQTFVGSSGRRSDSSAYISILDKRGKVCWNKLRSQCAPGQNLNIWNGTRVTKVLIDANKRAYGVEYAQAAGLDRTEHPTIPRSEDEAKKHNQPYNKWDKLATESGPKAERLGAPVSKTLAFDFNRPYDQYIPGTSTSYKKNTVTAKYEVILAAGAIVTPQLLMLSGIGPKDHLREKNIKLVQDLPVGTHTNDHQEVFLQWKFGLLYVPPFSILTDLLTGWPELQKFQNRQRSFYSSSGFAGGLDGSSDGPTGTTPKWHMHHLVGGAFEELDWNLAAYTETVTAPYRVPRSIVEITAWQGLSLHVHGCELSGNHAFGRIELRNTDPFVPPFVDPRWGSSDEDIAELVHCVKTMRQVMANTDNPNYSGTELEPSASAKTDQQITQFVRNNIWGHHVSGSAPMGSCDSPYAVTDSRGRVYGVDALRVVDISVFPTLPHGNPAGVVMMVAEKLAEQILKDYGVPVPPTL